MPSSIAASSASAGALRSGSSRSTSEPSRRTLRAATVSDFGSHATLAPSWIAAAKCASSSAGSSDAASWMRASRSPASSAATTMNSDLASAVASVNVAPRPPLSAYLPPPPSLARPIRSGYANASSRPTASPSARCGVAGARDGRMRPSCRSTCWTTRWTRRTAPESTVHPGRRGATMQHFDPVREVGVAKSGAGAQRIALREQRGDPAGESLESQVAAAQHHVRESRMQAERCHVAAERRDAATGVDGLEPCEQVACLRERRRWRRIDPRQGRGVVAAPAGEFERERREVCLEDLGRGLRQQRVVSRLAPQPVAGAGRGAARASAALVGRRARDAHGFEAAHAGGRVEALPALDAGVDDDANAVDGQAGLRDVGRDDHLAATVRIDPQRRVLFRGREVPVQRNDAELVRSERCAEFRDHAPDLARPGQEQQRVAVVLPQRAHGHGDDRPLDARAARRVAAGRRDVVRVHVEHPAGRANHRGVPEQAQQRLAVERRGHDQQPQRVPQVSLALEAQREAEVAPAGCARGTRRTRRRPCPRAQGRAAASW